MNPRSTWFACAKFSLRERQTNTPRPLMREVLAIIPARGGSKGIPGKNIRSLAGKPLIAHSIQHAREARQVTRVVVSTDDPSIAKVAADWAAEVVMRPAEIARDDSPSEQALLHVLDTLQKNEGYEPELVVFLQATSPIRRPGDVDGAIDSLVTAGADSLFSASPQHGFVWRADGGEPVSVTYDFRSRPQRQNAPVHVVENGSIYVFRPSILRAHGNRLGGRIATHTMGAKESVQIDEPGDLELAEALLVSAPTEIDVSELAGVRLLLLDFDGVMTDNRVMVAQDGTESVICHRGDGWGIGLVKKLGVEVVVVSTEKNSVVEARCKKLGIDFVQNCSDKGLAVSDLIRMRGLSDDQVAYVGNDVNDLPCADHVGFLIAVADAVPAFKSQARYVTRAQGGYGAVREVCELLLEAAGLDMADKQVVGVRREE
jgi:YrbI family 3-deoxy-D-manno-octulosonate 8-phosphate phosphatase